MDGKPFAAGRWLALLLVLACLQGGLDKAWALDAVGETHHFGLEPAAPLALAVIVLELGASLLILAGRLRRLGALALAAFTLAATFVANRFWSAPAPHRFMRENGLFEHLGLVGGFLLVAWMDRREAARAP